MFLARAHVFGLAFPENDSFEAAGILFSHKKLPWYWRGRFDEKIVHLATGEVKFIVSGSPNEVVTTAYDGVMDLASQLLTFAQRRPVFFRNVTLEGKDRIFSSKGWGRVGFPVKRPPRVRIDMTADFLENAMIRLADPQFQEETRAYTALSWVNETIVSGQAALELRFTMIWLALETLASAHHRRARIQPLLSREEMRSLRSTVMKWAETGVGSKRRSEELLERLGNMNRPLTRQRILRFGMHYGIQLDEDQLSSIIEIRNLIQHSPWAELDLFEQTHELLDDLVGRSIISVLGLDPERYVTA